LPTRPPSSGRIATDDRRPGRERSHHLILNGPRAATVSAAIETGAITLAPDLYVAEVANTLRKYVRAGRLDLDTARDSLPDAIELVTHPVPCSARR